MLKNWKYVPIGCCLFLIFTCESWAVGLGTLPDGAIGRLGDGVIQTVRYSPDGSFITVATTVGVRLLDATDSSRASFYRRDGFIHDISFLSTDLFAVSTSTGVRICSLSDIRREVKIPHQIQNVPVKTTAVSSNRKWFAAGLSKTVFIFPILADGTLGIALPQLTGQETVIDLAFKPMQNGSDEWLAVAYENEVILLKKGFADSQFRQEASIADVLDIITAITFNSDGSLLAIATASTEILLRNVREDSPEFIDGLQLVDEIPSDLIFHPTQPNLLGVTTDKRIQIWQFDAEDPTQRSPIFNQGFTAGGMSLRFNPEGTRLVVGAKAAPIQQALTIWDVETGDRMNTVGGFTAEVIGVSFPGASSNQLVAGYNSKQVIVWETAKRDFRTALTFLSFFNDVHFHPNGEQVAIGQANNQVAVRIITTDPPTNNDAAFGLTHPLNAVIQSVTFDPTGKWIASTANDGSIRVRLGGSEPFVKDDEFRATQVNDASFNVDGDLLAVVSDDGSLGIFGVSAETGVQPLSIEQIGRAATAVAFSLRSGDNQFGIGLADGGVQLWRVRPDNTVAMLNQLTTEPTIVTTPISALSLSHKGEWLAAGTQETVWVWDLNNPEGRAKLFKGHTAPVTGLSFSQETGGDSLLASSSLDGTILLWDVEQDPTVHEPKVEDWDLTEPEANAENVPATTQIRIRIPGFDGVNSDTLTPFNFRVEGVVEKGTPKIYSKTSDQYQIEETNTITFDPGEILREKETIAVTLKSGIEDRFGNFVEAKSVTFTTGLIVLPGDTNSDGQVNIFDILPLGQFWKEQGEPRPKQSEVWELQSAIAWPIEKATYADANGDGQVNAVDILTIEKNWKQNRTNLPLQATSSPIGDWELGDAQSSMDGSDNFAFLEIYEQLYAVLQNHSRRTDRLSELQQLLRQMIDRLKQRSLPTATKLFSNYPNPFNPETWIPYQLAEGVEATIRIYDMHGRLVRTLDLGYKSIGYYIDKAEAAYWDGRNNLEERVASGVYFYRFDAGHFSAQKRLVIVK